MKAKARVRAKGGDIKLTFTAEIETKTGSRSLTRDEVNRVRLAAAERLMFAMTELPLVKVSMSELKVD